MPISPPPSKNGQAVPHDHPELLNPDLIVRRISLQWVVDKTGGKRLSSEAFECSTDGSGVSLDIAKLIEEKGANVATYVSSPVHVGAIQWTAGQVRGHTNIVGYDPLPENDCHGAAWPVPYPTTSAQRKAAKRAAKSLIAEATWCVPIPGVDVA
ncbi:hypothetical protein BH10PLA2_BH10PLA2_38650 [soil metagenome]